jgi:hypothetical protein
LAVSSDQVRGQCLAYVPNTHGGRTAIPKELGEVSRPKVADVAVSHEECMQRFPDGGAMVAKRGIRATSF